MRCFKTPVKKAIRIETLRIRRVGVAINAKDTETLMKMTVPLLLGTKGRESGLLRLRLVHQTDSATLSEHVHSFTLPTTTVYTDGWRGYNRIDRAHMIVCHKDGEWARDEDGDGIYETHTNTIEGVWTTVRNFLRPFRGVHKKFLAGYIAISEFIINLKSVSVDFISKLVKSTYS